MKKTGRIVTSIIHFFRNGGGFLDRSFRTEGSRPPGLKEEAGPLRRAKARRILLLAGIGLAVFLGGLWNGFPHREMARHFLREISETAGVGLFARQARFDLPARITYSGLAIVTPSQEGPLSWSVDRASGHLVLASLVSRKPRFNFRIDAYGGEFRGLLRHLSRRRNHLKGSTVRPLDLGKTRPVLHQDIAGTMNVKTDYTWKTGNETTGHGIVSADIGHLVLKSLTMNGFPIPPVTFDSVRSRVFLSNGRGRVEKLVASGPLADINGTGTFLLSAPYANTILHLTLLVHLKGPLGAIPLLNMAEGGKGNKVMTLTLDGPVSNLNIAMNGLPIPH